MVWNTEMELYLAEAYEVYRKIIESKGRDVAHNDKRNRAWEEICSGLNSRFPLQKLSVEQVKSKHKKLLQRAKFYETNQFRKV